MKQFLRHIFLLVALFMVTANAWALRYAKAIAKSSPTQGGWVWVTKTDGNAPSTWERTEDSSEDDNLKTSNYTFPFYYYAKPQAGYEFKGWATASNTNTLSSTVQTNWYVGVTATSSNNVNWKPATATYYAIFAKLTTNVSSLSFEKNVDEGWGTEQSLVATYVHAGDVTAKISGEHASDFSFSNSSLINQKTIASNNTDVESSQTIYIFFNPSNSGNRTATLTFSGNGMTKTVVLNGKGIKLDQTLSWNNESAIETNMQLGKTQTVTATATSGLAVAYSSSDNRVLTVDASGKITAVGIGNATITASQAGNYKYNAADPSITKSYTVWNKNTPIFTPNGFNEANVCHLKVGDKVTLEVLNVSDGLSGDFKVNTDNNILGITRNGNTITIEALNAGTADAIFTQTENNDIFGAEKKYQFSVSKINNTLAIASSSYTKYVDDEITNIISSVNSDATVTTSSSDATIAYYDVTSNKILIPNSEAKSFSSKTISITIEQAETYKYTAAKKTITLTVNKHTPVFTLNPAVTNSPEKLYFNKEYPNYFTTNANSPLTITSSDELVAKWVPGSNAQSYTLQTFSKTNTATLTAIQHENYYWQRWEGSIDIQLQDPNNHVQNTPLTQENYIKDFQYSYQDPAADAKSPMGPDWNDGIYFGGEGAFDGDEGWNWGEKYIIIKFSGIPDSIYFTANRSGSATGTINLSIKQGTSPNNFEENIWESSESSNNNIGRKLKSDPTYNYLKISYEGNLWGRFKDVRITELNQFEAIDANKNLLTAINFGNALAVGVNHNQTFSFRYANAGHKVKFEIVSDTPENTATAKKYLSFLHSDFVTLDGEKCLTSIGGEKVGTVQNITVQFYSEKNDYTIPANTKIKISDEVGHTYYIPITGNIERATQTLSWQGLFLKDPVILPLTTGTFTGVAISSNPDLPITYTSSNPDVIAVSADGKSLTPKAEGEVYITANQVGDDKYKPAEPITKAVIVTGKKVQVIIWESNLTDLVVGDAPVTLSAKVYWIDMDNGAQGVYSEEQTRKLQFTSADPSIVSIEGNILTIHNVGETTVTAYVPGDDTYKEDQQVIPVRVRPTIVGCEDVLLLDHPDEFEFFKFDLSTPEVISPTYEIDHSKGVPGTLEFQHTGKPWTFAIEYYEGTIHAQQSIDGSTWTTVASVTPTKNATNISEGSPLDRQAKYIRFVRAQGGIGYHYVSNIKVHPVQYIEPSQEVIDFSTVQYGSKNTFTFDVAYSNIKYQLSPKTSASDVQVSPQSFGACGAFGTQTITGTWTPNEGGDNITRTIIFTDVNTGMSATVTLKANVLKKDQFIKWEDAPAEIDDYSDIDSRPLKTVNASDEEVRDITYEIVNGTNLAAFDNGMFYLKGTGDIRIRAYHNGDAEYKPVEQFYNIHIASIQPTFLGTKNQDWTIHENWVNGIQPNGSDDFVVILAPTSISGMQINVKGLQIADNGAITVTSTGGMTVGEKGVSSAKNESRISIDNTPEGAGFFRIHPVAVTNGDTPATVTVNYTTKAKSGDPRDEIWQYVGAPGNNMQMSNDGILVYHWKEQKGWLLADTKMQPFVGYALTRTTEGSNNYEIHAEPVYTDQVIQLTKTASGMNGDNLFANSYLAPIDVRKIDKDDIIDPDNKLTRTFFLFNSGSWNDWKQGAGDITAAGYDHSSAGHYYSIPFYSAKLIDDGTSQVVIPPMQGVYVYSEGEATIKFNYAKHVYGADASDLNKPMRMPQEKTWSDSFRRVRIQATSKNSGADRMYIVQEENTTSKYDNGYDGDNILAAKQVNIYTNEPFGQMEVSCSNNIDSMFIGFTAGEDSEYTLTFGAVVGKDMYLKDIEKNESILITDGGQYIFYAQPNSVNDMRFQLLLDPHLSNDNLDDDGVTTGGDNICSDITRVWINDKKLYVADVPKNTKLAVYTASGVCIATPYIIHHTPYTLDLSYLPTGVYVLRLNNQAYKFVCE